MMIADNAELHRRQRSFRQVLDAFARPGTVRLIELDAPDEARPASLDGALCALVRLFVDQAVSFAVADAESDAAARYLSSETHARRTSVDRADFVIVPARADERLACEALSQAKAGTPASPELGATVIVGCVHIEPADGEADAAGESRVLADPDGMAVAAVRGPGVESVNRFRVDRAAWANARAARGDEFPCGVEVVLVAPDGRVAALPRTSVVTVEGPAADALRQDAAEGFAEREVR